MKIILFISLLILAIQPVEGQSDAEYYFSMVYPSPSGKKVIIVDYPDEGDVPCAHFPYFKTKEETLVHQFDSIYTFWPIQIDCIQFPELKYNSTYPSGLVCILYNKDNHEEIHTAVLGSGGVSLWKEGNFFDCLGCPPSD